MKENKIENSSLYGVLGEVNFPSIKPKETAIDVSSMYPEGMTKRDNDLTQLDPEELTIEESMDYTFKNVFVVADLILMAGSGRVYRDLIKLQKKYKKEFNEEDSK